MQEGEATVDAVCKDVLPGPSCCSQNSADFDVASCNSLTCTPALTSQQLYTARQQVTKGAWWGNVAWEPPEPTDGLSSKNTRCTIVTLVAVCLQLLVAATRGTVVRIIVVTHTLLTMLQYSPSAELEVTSARMEHEHGWSAHKRLCTDLRMLVSASWCVGGNEAGRQTVWPMRDSAATEPRTNQRRQTQAPTGCASTKLGAELIVNKIQRLQTCMQVL